MNCKGCGVPTQEQTAVLGKQVVICSDCKNILTRVLDEFQQDENAVYSVSDMEESFCAGADWHNMPWKYQGFKGFMKMYIKNNNNNG